MFKLKGLPILGIFLMLGACTGDSAPNMMASARAHLAKNDGQAAVIQLKNALQKDPQYAEARFLLGKLMLESGDVVGALVELRKAQDLGYDANQVVPLLATAIYAKDGPQKVISQFSNEMMGTAAAQTELQIVLASANLSLGNNVEARARVDAALKASPSHVGAQLLRIRMTAAEKTSSEILVEVDAVIAAAPTDSQARLLKGELLALDGKQDAAIAAFREAIERDRNNVAAHSAALWMLLAKKDLTAAELQLQGMRSVVPQSPQTKFFAASLAFEKNDIKAAKEQVQSLLEKTPNSSIVLQLAGAIEFSQGSLLQAESYLSKALQISPSQQKIRLLLVKTHLRAGEPAKAIKLLQPLTDSKVLQWEPQVLMAQAQLMNGDSAKAETYFARAAKLNPNDTNSLTVLALAQVAKGQVEQGFDSLRTISAADPGTTADLALINAYLRKKDFDNALKAIERLQKKQPSSPIAADLRGRTELQRGHPDQARAAFLAALAIDRSFFPATSSIVSLDIADGRVDLAQQRLEKFIQGNPRDVRGGVALARLRAQAGASNDEVIDILKRTIKSNPLDATPWLAVIGTYLERKDFKAALTAAQDGLAALPDNVDVLDALGQAQFFMGEVNQAFATYNKIASLQPNATLPFMRLAEIYRLRKDEPSAVQNLRKALAIKSDLLPAHQALMTIDLAAGRRKEALNTARILQRQPDNEIAGYALEGDFQLSQKNWNAAAIAYRRALDRRSSSELAIKLHRALLLADKRDEAAKLEQQWTRQHSDDAAFVFYLGNEALNNSQYDLAKQRYQAVIKILPGSAPALNNLAWLLGREKKPEALALALRAASLAPREPAFMDTVAEIYSRNGDPAKALEAQLKAVELAPEVGIYRLHLAAYYLDMNEKAKAKIELTRLADLGDRFKRQAEVKALLAKF